MTASPFANKCFCSQYALEKIDSLNQTKAFGRRLNRPTVEVYGTVLKVLWLLANSDERTYVSSNGSTLVTCKAYQVRKSWDIILDVCGQAGVDLSERHLRRICNDLIAAGLMRKFHEKKGRSTHKGAPAFEDLCGPARFPMWKVIEMITFELPEPVYEEATEAVEHLIEQVNSEPALVENVVECADAEPGYVGLNSSKFGAPTAHSRFIANLEEHVPDLDPTDFNIDDTIHQSCPTKTTPYTNTVIESDKGTGTKGCLSDNFDRPLVAPNTESDEDWKAEVIRSIQGKDKRRVIARKDVPKFVNSPYYLTWMLERAGLYWAPWVLWDIDATGEETVEDSYRRAKGFTERLLRIGVPQHALRVVFSTNKGFHIYMDSRCIGLKPMPEGQLLDTLKDFCLRMLPSADTHMYNKRQLVGLPNSRHTKTGKFYTILDLGTFLNGSVQEFLELAETPGDPLVRSKDVQEIPALTGGFVTAAQIKKHLAPSFDDLKRLADRSEFYGVGKGQRQSAMFELIMKYKRMDLTKDEILCLVRSANSRNKPPLDEREIVPTIEKVFRYLRSKGRG